MMATEVLEQILEPNNFEPIGDICSRTNLLLYWYDKHPKKKKPFEPYFPTDTGFGIYHPKKKINPIIKDIHDTFKIDRYDNIYGGHTTAYIPGFHKRSIFHKTHKGPRIPGIPHGRH